MSIEGFKKRVAGILTRKVPKDAVMSVTVAGLFFCIVIATALSALLRSCLTGGM